MKGILQKSSKKDILLGKRGVMNEIIGVFILLLVVSIIAGMTFLFLNGLKDTTGEMGLETYYIYNETLDSMTEAGEYVVNIHRPNFAMSTTIVATNASSGNLIPSTNYTVTSAGLISITIADSYNNSDWNVSYNYNSAEGSAAYSAVNDTEEAGTTLVDFLPILFLAIIFGAILTVVLRVILPFINLGQQTGF